MEVIAVITAIGILILTIGGIVTMVHKAFRSAVNELKNTVIETVNERTTQIQIDSNGGKSLTDVAKAVHRIEDNQQAFKDDLVEIKQDVIAVKERVVSLENVDN